MDSGYSQPPSEQPAKLMVQDMNQVLGNINEIRSHLYETLSLHDQIHEYLYGPSNVKGGVDAKEAPSGMLPQLNDLTNDMVRQADNAVGRLRQLAAALGVPL